MRNYKEKSSKQEPQGEHKSMADKAVDKFTQMMIDKLETIKASDWKQGWTNGSSATFGMPQNLTGRNYSGTNSFFLQMDTAMHGYNAPVYLTFHQAVEQNLHIKKGSESMPVLYWDLSIKDKDGHRVSREDFRRMSQERQKEMEIHPFLKAFAVFNIDQTNLQEINKERYDAILARFKGPQLRDEKGMYENPALDRLFQLSNPGIPKGQTAWLCPIQTDKLADGAFYSPSRDLVVVPMKAQFNISKDKENIFKDGMEYYSSALHEMSHSTGTKERLNREAGVRFGDAKYAKEELVAELTAAMVGNAMGFDKRILNNNAAYVEGWINALREDPKFIVSVMADVNKASNVILQKVDEQKIALGETPILTQNRVSDGKEEHVAAKQPAAMAPVSVDFDSGSIFKKRDGSYAARATYQGQSLGIKPVSMVTGARYQMMPDGPMKAQMLKDTLSEKFAGSVRAMQTDETKRKQMKL